MTGHRGSRWWWTLAVLPAMAVSACGGSRLSHDDIVAAANGSPLLTGVAQQQQSAVSAPAQSGGVTSLAGSGAAARGAVSAAPVTVGTGTRRAGVAGGGAAAGVATGSAPSAAHPAGPLAP